MNSIYRGLVAAAIPRLPDDKNLRYMAELLRDRAGTFVPMYVPELHTTRDCADKIAIRHG